MPVDLAKIGSTISSADWNKIDCSTGWGVLKLGKTSLNLGNLSKYSLYTGVFLDTQTPKITASPSTKDDFVPSPNILISN